ncbi:UNKNOWN [Stylonychia lemnae]|uniref:Uncharacterized protein n=1 Tax=Stylonychia lemnae TaxID=5949 RepID=A0A078AH82_STYLE|nr:UNKNOWN [Stylonychia lemnae]|eukprot:CDW81645.1 UNKNOWN [Stylonychia lemnae]
MPSQKLNTINKAQSHDSRQQPYVQQQNQYDRLQQNYPDQSRAYSNDQYNQAYNDTRISNTSASYIRKNEQNLAYEKFKEERLNMAQSNQYQSQLAMQRQQQPQQIKQNQNIERNYSQQSFNPVQQEDKNKLLLDYEVNMQRNQKQIANSGVQHNANSNQEENEDEEEEDENSDGNDVDDLENIVNNLKAEIQNLQVRFQSQNKSPQKQNLNQQLSKSNINNNQTQPYIPVRQNFNDVNNLNNPSEKYNTQNLIRNKSDLQNSSEQTQLSQQIPKSNQQLKQSPRFINPNTNQNKQNRKYPAQQLSFLTKSQEKIKKNSKNQSPKETRFLPSNNTNKNFNSLQPRRTNYIQKQPIHAQQLQTSQQQQKQQQPLTLQRPRNFNTLNTQNVSNNYQRPHFNITDQKPEQKYQNYISSSKDMPLTYKNKSINQDLMSETNDIEMRLDPNNDTVEERLFKFSPLSSKKFDEEDHNGGSQRSFQNNSIINDTSSLNYNSNSQYADQTPVGQKKRSSLNNTQIKNNSNLDGYNPLRLSQSPIQSSQNMKQFHRNANNYSKISNENEDIMNTSTVSQQNTQTYVQQQRFFNEQQQLQKQIPASVIHHSRENSMPPMIYKREQTPQTAIRNLSKIVVQSTNQSVQTEPRGPLMLSPFETYDLLFVRDTINNLNFDNEILNQNVEDLKSGFLYLYQKHKDLLYNYNKELQNKQILENYRKKIAELIIQNQKTEAQNLQLQLKVKSMTEIIQLSTNEQFFSMQDDQILIEQLEEENRNLRQLISISNFVNQEVTIEEVESALKEEEKLVQEFDYQLMQTENLRKLQELEKIRMELSSDIEEILRQEYEQKFQKLAEETAQLVKESADFNKNLQIKPEQQDVETQIFINDNFKNSEENLLTEEANDVSNESQRLIIQQKCSTNSTKKLIKKNFQNKDKQLKDDTAENNKYIDDLPYLNEVQQELFNKENDQRSLEEDKLNDDDEFNEYFGDQPLDEEEKQFIRELKLREKRESNTLQEKNIDSQNKLEDFNKDLSISESEEEDEDEKQMKKLIEIQKQNDFYQVDDEEDDDEEDDDDFMYEQGINQNNKAIYEQIRKQKVDQEMQNDGRLIRRNRSDGDGETNNLNYNDYMDDFYPEEDEFNNIHGEADNLHETDQQDDVLDQQDEQARKEQQFRQQLFESGLPKIHGNGQQFNFDDDDDQFLKDFTQDFQQQLDGQSKMNEEQFFDDLSGGRINGLDSSKVRQHHIIESDKGEILFDLQRDEEKEEEYDYFNQQNENMVGNNDYHIMDENIQNNDEEEEEMLDDEEKKERNRFMLKELQQNFEKEGDQQFNQN